MKLIVFSSPNCKFCPKAKEVAGQVGEELGITTETLCISTEEGSKLANALTIMSVPSFALLNDKSECMWVNVGLMDKYNLKTKIEGTLWNINYKN